MIVEIDLGVLRLELDEVSADRVDVEVDQAMRAKHKEVFCACAARIEEAAASDKACPACCERMIGQGRVTRRVGTLAGPVSLRRRRLRCPCCGAERYPLDESLDLCARHTLPAVERALYLATETSYAKASATLERLTGAKISHGQIQSLAKREGALVGRELDRMSAELFEHGIDPGEIRPRTLSDTLVITIDGGAIPDRATQDDFEAKVGVIYGVKAKVSKDRTALIDRVCYASLETSFEFGKKLYTLARRHGVASAGRVLCIGDGAVWIRRLVRDLFPGAIYLLDLFHLKKRLREVLREETDEELRERITAACLAGDPAHALTLLGSFVPITPEQAEAARKLKGYIYANRLGIANYTHTDLYGSGAVEKAVDIIVSRRFKLRGMSWLRPGAAGMLKLKLLKYNGEWDEHWRQRMAACT